MRFFRVAAMSAMAIALATTTLLAQKQLAMLASVSTATGQDVQITAADVEVTEDGKRIPVSKVELAPRVPKLQILIDNGLGIPSASIGDLRNGLKGLLQQLPPNLEVSLYTTAPQGRALEKATTDRVKLLSAIDRLTPDPGTGRFVESLLEATERVAKDKDENAAYAIVNVASATGDANYRDNDAKLIVQNVQRLHPTVHTILLDNLTSGSGGRVQTDLGKGLADMTGGQFTSIALANRLVTLLPDLGSELNKTMGSHVRLLRLTADRPTAGQLGQVAVNVKGLTVLHLALDASRTK